MVRGVRAFALIDAVRVADNLAGFRLAEDHVQPGERHAPTADHVAQHVARAHAGKLIHVADQQQVRVRRDRFSRL